MVTLAVKASGGRFEVGPGGVSERDGFRLFGRRSARFAAWSTIVRAVTINDTPSSDTPHVAGLYLILQEGEPLRIDRSVLTGTEWREFIKILEARQIPFGNKRS